MKKNLIFLGLIIFTGYILLFPKEAVASAAFGLMLWYERILPTLLPFTIVANLFIASNYLQYITRLMTPLGRLLPISENGLFVLLAGFLFGFPMGSRLCAQLLSAGKLSKEEANILFIITNNMSPVFVSSYILCQELMMPELTLCSYIALYLPPLLIGFYLLSRSHTAICSTKAGKRTVTKPDISTKKAASGSQMNFKIIDAGIMNGFETLTKLGGYIMLFSMIASLIQHLPLSILPQTVLTGIIEITNGIHGIKDSGLSPRGSYLLAMSFTAFGGLSGVAQTSSMIRQTSLSIKKYMAGKLLLTLLTAALSWFLSGFANLTYQM
jgi:sporulation integral membrane protein YlbJ